LILVADTESQALTLTLSHSVGDGTALNGSLDRVPSTAKRERARVRVRSAVL